MKNVFVVGSGFEGDFGIAGIFSTEEKATKFYDDMGGKKEYYHIPEKHIVDENEIKNPYEIAIKELEIYANASWGGVKEAFLLAIKTLKEKEHKEYFEVKSEFEKENENENENRQHNKQPMVSQG